MATPVCTFNTNDLTLLLSGGGFNSDPSLSLGGEISFKEASTDFFGVLTLPIGGSKTDFRCFYIRNDSDLDVSTLNFFINSEIPEGSDVELGLGAEVNGSAFLLENPESVPPGVVFSQPSAVDPLVISDVGSGDFISIWVKRSVSFDATPLQGDGVAFGLTGDFNCLCSVPCTGGFSSGWSFGFRRCP